MKHMLWAVVVISVLVGLVALTFENPFFGSAACISGATWIACACIMGAVEEVGGKLNKTMETFLKRLE